MSLSSLSRLFRVELAPPAYLAQKAAGVDISMSGIKFVTLKETRAGLVLDSCGERHLPPGVFVNGDIVEPAVLTKELSLMAKEFNIRAANVSLPEAKSYLFDAQVPTDTGVPQTKESWRVAVEQHLEEYVPLPPREVTFDLAPFPGNAHPGMVAGVGYAHRVIDETVAAVSAAGIAVQSLEPEMYALARAVIPAESTETVLIADIGKTTTKLVVTEGRIPRFATTLAIGGHALTLAVQKHFGVSEADARRIKVTRGLSGGEDGDEYVAALLGTAAALKEEIARRLDYWQTHVTTTPGLSPIARVSLVGGNASLAGLPEYLSAGLGMPVALADVFRNFAPRTAWLPPLEYSESLAYGSAIGLALREYTYDA